MGKKQTKQGLFFPSLLDRIIDDSQLMGQIEQCKLDLEHIKTQLERSEEGSETRKQQQKNYERRLFEYKQLTESSGSLNNIKDCVKRDLEWLFNAHNLCLDDVLERHYPHTKRSVLNYGIADLTGKTISSINASKLEKLLKNSIKSFEPRLIPEKLQVKLLHNKKTMEKNAIFFEIKGELWTGERPIHLEITTQLDLENGNIEIK
ncbi:MAG: type VI secretion system baseplate subunit TssE [bacterium]